MYAYVNVWIARSPPFASHNQTGAHAHGKWTVDIFSSVRNVCAVCVCGLRCTSLNNDGNSAAENLLNFQNIFTYLYFHRRRPWANTLRPYLPYSGSLHTNDEFICQYFLQSNRFFFSVFSGKQSLFVIAWWFLASFFQPSSSSSPFQIEKKK